MTPPKKRDGVPDPLILCAPKSRTYIALTPGFPVDTRHIRPVVVSAYQQILHITAPPPEDHVISFSSGWIFNITIGAYSLRVKNAGLEDSPLWLYGLTGPVNAVPRHITYGVLGKALLALYIHMNEHGWRQAEFEIWDAGKEFGFGILGPRV
ncbi:MAG: hypothetical protein L6R38_006692 [Xanthoria sp. 2 TBL-2021]|nr:MAG: hypothetical protein L6R38_006692 [Xanthoria sp. 2 TBL-2021]